MKQALLIAAAAASLGASPAAAAAEPFGRETSIAFADHGGIADWLALDEGSIYLMDRTGRWYLARFQGSCFKLPVVNNVAFRTGVTGQFDRFSSVITENGSCPVESVVRAARPDAKGGNRLPGARR